MSTWYKKKYQYLFTKQNLYVSYENVGDLY